MVILQVLIAAYGRDGIIRAASLDLPATDGVGYIIGWQRAGCVMDIPPQLRRPDIDVIATDTIGLAANRNILLDHASAPYLKFSDDDVTLTEQDLTDLIKAFDNYPDADILLTRFGSPTRTPSAPANTFVIQDAPRGYWPSAIEINIRRSKVALRFDTRFGLNSSRYPYGEDDIYIVDAIRSGLTVRYVPVMVGRHEHLSSGERIHPLDRKFLATKTAVLRRLHPFSWPLHIMAHIIRSLKDQFTGRRP